MKYSNTALQLLAAKECGVIKSNAQFWRDYPNIQIFESLLLTNNDIIDLAEQLSQQYPLSDQDEGFICAYDENFPVINQKAKNSDKPYLLFYKGDISLLSDLNKNVAVIGLIDPTPEVEKREIAVVEQLVKSDLVIVSGLAKGCDAIAHRVCLETGGKTIAILPTTLQKISPATNRGLANNIVANGGLLLTEYYKESLSKQETINRYIERDRLQAMFAKAVILIASYRKGEGDSGSRHAMESAKNYEIPRYAMYNTTTDIDDKQFGLNKDLLNLTSTNVKVLQLSSIQEIKSTSIPVLEKNSPFFHSTQMTLF